MSDGVQLTEKVLAAFLARVHDVEGEAKQKATVHHITEHDTKQKGERHTREDSRICLFVVRNAVGIHNLLENARKFCFTEHGGPGQLTIDLPGLHVNVKLVDSLHVLHMEEPLLLAVGRHPHEADADGVADLLHVEGLVDGLLPVDELLEDPAP